jgi:hypothetical protein
MTGILHRLSLVALTVMFAVLSLECASAEDSPQSSIPPEKKQDQQLAPPDPSQPQPMWLRLVKVEISKESPLRDDKQFNNPPCVYVAFKASGQKTSYSTKHCEWQVSFPDDFDHNQLLVTPDEDSEYTFEIWDSQYRSNKQLFSIGPITGSALQQQLSPVDEKDASKQRLLVLENKEAKANLTFAFAGTRGYYRLTNITIPPESAHRKTLPSPPYLYLTVRIDGKQLGDCSTVRHGWSADFPKEAKNAWFIREGGPVRYSIEVWNDGYVYNDLLFTITGVSGTDFRSVLKEPVDKLLGPDVAATVHFEQCEPPSE